jgi:DNA-binding XRE family transcriptional regulator
MSLPSVWRALEALGGKLPRPVVVRCCTCGHEIARWSHYSCPVTGVLCLACLSQRPAATTAQRLRAHRIAAGLSTRALAQRAGLTQGVVAGIETGRRKPSRETLARLANALGPGVLLPATE